MNLLRINDLAAKLQMSKSNVRKLLREGELPKPMIIGDRIHVWNEATINTWLEHKERSSVSGDHMPHDQD